MQSLDLKVPPTIVALLLAIAIAIWAVASGADLVAVPAFIRIAVAAVLAAMGGGFSLAGVLAFRRARTTVNPIKPETTTALVTGGVYRITRNPMYVGLLILLVAWAVYLPFTWALIGPILFMLYITRFQILPEERALLAMFGETFAAYQTRVRRWL
jgi:protein-S-isoprenylcysteine O-methyltransferase Ste14